MTTRLLQLEQATLSYSKTGNGSKILFAFHGFGQNGQAFSKVSGSLSDRYTIYSFDLFFHGNSQWGYEELPLEKDFWNRLIRKFLSEQSISEFSVLGFSMGGKFALATLEGFPTQVKEIFLIAPDGIKTSMWYSLATYPTAMRNLFKSTITNPQRFNAIVSFAYRTGLIDKGIRRFVEFQMNTEEKRQRVYSSWVVFRHLSFDIKNVSRIINHHQIKLIVIVGKFDKIITARNMTKLTNLVPHTQLQIIETGHNGVVDGSVEILKTIK